MIDLINSRDFIVILLIDKYRLGIYIAIISTFEVLRLKPSTSSKSAMETPEQFVKSGQI